MEQGKELERFFQNKRYPSYHERETLAARLNLQEQQVLVWFKNCRAKQSRLQRATSPGSTSCPGLPEEPKLPWELLLSQDPLFSVGSKLSGDAGFDNHFLGVAAAEPGTSSHLQAPRGPPQDAQDPVPAAAAPAPAPAPAEDPVFPEISTDVNFWTELDFSDLLSLQDLTPEPSFWTSLEI